MLCLGEPVSSTMQYMHTLQVWFLPKERGT